MVENEENFKNTVMYQSQADENFHLFFKIESFLLDIPHFHDSIEMIFMLHGETKAHINGKLHTIKEGQICFCAKGQVHYYDNAQKDHKAICLVLSHGYTHHFRLQYKDATLPTVMGNIEKNKEIFNLLLNWLDYENKSYLYNCAQINLLFDMIIKKYGIEKPEKSTKNDNSIKFINYINENYNKNISLKTMAEHFYYTTEYCSKLFNELIGQHFSDVLNNIRIKNAVEMINNQSQNKKSLDEILYACGYNSAVTFYRHYKKYKERANIVKLY